MNEFGDSKRSLNKATAKAVRSGAAVLLITYLVGEAYFFAKYGFHFSNLVSTRVLLSSGPFAVVVAVVTFIDARKNGQPSGDRAD